MAFGRINKLAEVQERIKALDVAMQQAKEAEKLASEAVKVLSLKQQIEIQKGPPELDGLSGLGFWPVLLAIGSQIAGAVAAKQAAKKQQKMIEQQRKIAEAQAKAAEVEAQAIAQKQAITQKQDVMGIPTNILVVGGVGIIGTLILVLILRNR